MEELKQFINKYNRPVTQQEFEKIIYNIFFIGIFLAPIIPEIIGYGLYSLRNTLFNTITLITSVVLLIANIGKLKDLKNAKVHFHYVLLAIYFMFVVLSAIFSKFGIMNCILGENGRGEGVITILSYIATFVIFAKGYEDIKKVSKLAIIGMVVICIYSFLQVNALELVKDFFPTNPVNVATGTMKNQNFLSSYICMFLPMMCYYTINVKNKFKLGHILSVLLFITLIYSSTLGGYITFAFMYIAVVIFSIIFSKQKVKTLISVLILSLVLCTTYFAITYSPESEVYTNQIKSSVDEVEKLAKGDDDFGTSRMEIWKKSIDIIDDNILLGIGPDSMAEELKNKKYIVKGDNDILNKYIIDKAHSEPIHIAVTTGVPSALVYLFLAASVGISLLVAVVKDVKKNRLDEENTRYNTMVLVCMLSYLMQSMINISVVQVAPMFWAIFGTAAGIVQNKKISTR